MAEYIKREDAIKIAEKYGLANGSALGRHTGLADCIASEIAAIPAADVAPVVHAKWEMRRVYVNGYEGSGEEKAFCSHCNKSNKQYTPPYCPHCGAKMDEEDEQ